MTLSELTLDVLTGIAASSPNEESCGLVDTNGNVYLIENISKQKENSFVFNKRQYMTVRQNIRKSGAQVFCVFHTHPSNNTTPSKADIEFAERAKFPSLIVTKYEHRWVI